MEENNMASFRDMAIRAILAQAKNTHKNILAMNVSSFNELGKLAWFDCLKLYEDALYQLNKSINNVHKSNDVQTWLSAAMANLQTCLNGFQDFKLSSYLEKIPFVMLDDFSKNVCNSLAINKLASTSQVMLENHTQKLEIPEWLSVQEITSIEADVVVAKDGSGNYSTISEALSAVKRMRNNGTERFVIYVKSGIYQEYVKINKSMNNLMFVGDGIDVTVITGNRSNRTGFTTFRSATFDVSGGGFIAKDITFENTAGPEQGQAVALRSDSDLSVFHRCSFKGYQDTLYVHAHRQFYRDCDIYGTVDFIFGDATAVFQNCNIYIRKPNEGQVNTITAQGKKCPYENTGIIIHNSIVTASPELSPVEGLFKSYLGRPWRQYSTTLFIKTYIDSLIDSTGWLPWNGDFALNTLFYGEYNNTGAGAPTSGRVSWSGYHVITNVIEVEKFSVRNFLDGDTWLPGTRIPYTSDL
ncbi:putative pectinesterase/pectinesterase inhibitor 17 [Capsicum baccatum]|uniref:Pectinesterase n=1 Tax=Capsicum baccatum TaxID=33114 RepID=A0A2G2WN62_CAPBA|nr:putative pectinesterase/pectinesterase inhibitor 17 [Capsicum baccatum]